MDVLYFHSPCFDGAVSAAITAEFLEGAHGWSFGALRPVNYHLQGAWLDTPLEGRSAVVDFLYHPDASFWVDHHETAFVSPEARAHHAARDEPWLVYDRSAKSAAALMWTRFSADLDDRFARLAKAASKTDAAEYDDVEEALAGDAPELRINAALAIDADDAFCVELVGRLRGGDLAVVAGWAEVRRRAERYRALSEEGLARLGAAIREPGADGIAEFDVDGRDVVVPRYGPYRFHRGRALLRGHRPRDARRQGHDDAQSLARLRQRAARRDLRTIRRRRPPPRRVDHGRGRRYGTRRGDPPGSRARDPGSGARNSVIERFNFYDVYGYLLPGVLLLAMLQLPYAAVTGDWMLPDGVASALLAVAVSYVTGHLIQVAGRDLVPSALKRPDGSRRYPSAYVLDKDGALGGRLREDVAERILALFSLEVREERSPDAGRDRQDAFLRCRARLVQLERARYLEQFQGLYTMMRGLFTASVLATAWACGWFLGGVPAWFMVTIFALAFCGLLAAVQWGVPRLPRLPEAWARRRGGPALVLLTVAVVAGLVWARGWSSPQDRPGPATLAWLLPLLIGAAYLLFAFVFRKQYAFYCEEFAKCVYRDFLVATEPEPPKPKPKPKPAARKKTAKKKTTRG